MKVSKDQESSKGDEGISKKTLDDRQRKDAVKSKETNASRANSNPNDAGKLAEG